MADKELKGINRGWAGRALATGKIAASAAHLAARRLVGAEGEKDGLIGLDLAKELDQMKGMAMKVGQIISYFDGVLPDETHKALQSLQRGTRPVAFETMGKVIEDAFAQPVDALFDAFDRQAVAAASIGQVYRARYQGAPVAVKVQYPRVRETMDADFSRIGALARLASLATAVDGMALVRELQERVDAECDYELEATHQTAFARAFAGDRAVHIPAVVPDRTRKTVLTTEWCEGRDFYTFVAQAGRERKDAAALVLSRFAWRSFFELGTLNADPHPGNYLFPETGPIVFLDFGCVRRFEPAFLEAERRLAEVVVNDRRSAFRDALMATGMVAKPGGFDFDLHWRMLCHQYAPYRVPRFRFTFDYIRQINDFSGPTNPNLRRLAIPPPWIWLQRLQWGLHAVLARLDAEGPFADVYREALTSRLTGLEVAAS